MSKIVNSITSSGKILLEVFEKVSDSTIGEDFFLTRSGMRKTAQKLAMNETNFCRNIRRLEQKGFLEKSERGFAITPRGLKKVKIMSIENDNWTQKKWDGYWKLVIFDVPEEKKNVREMLRGFLVRKGFYRLQDSVFISPFADLDALNFIRHEYGVSKNVNILISKTSEVDDDRQLKKYFNL